jgi:hypothetical protein
VFGRSLSAEPIPYECCAESRKAFDVQPKRKPGLIGLTVALVLCLTLTIFCVIAIARSETVSFPGTPPSRYLPGNPRPQHVPCTASPDERTYSVCTAEVFPYKIYVSLDEGKPIIVMTLVPGDGYALGQLILAWGTPTGIAQDSHSAYIYWGTRVASLPTRSFRPDGQIDYIQYDLFPSKASPWRGFTLRNH